MGLSPILVMGLALTASGVAFIAIDQQDAGVPPPPTQGGSGQAPTPAPLIEPAVPPSEPAAAASSFAPRNAVDCADFRAGPGATWRAVASVRIPGPQGPIQIAAGQTLSPGVYVSGLDLAAILQARCF